MQPPRMALTTSGGPGNTNNNCAANALKEPNGIKNTKNKRILAMLMIPQTLNWPFSVTTGPKIKTSGASCSEIVQIFIFSTSSIH